MHLGNIMGVEKFHIPPPGFARPASPAAAAVLEPLPGLIVELHVSYRLGRFSC